MAERNYMLKSTFEIIKKEIEVLNNKLSAIPEQLRQSYETGGYWHDNPHWDYTMQDQQTLSRRISELLNGIINPIFIDELTDFTDQVLIGTLVIVKDNNNGTVEEWNIVGSLDLIYNPRCQIGHFISYQSPLARALMTKKCNEEVTIQLPTKIKKVIITSIKRIRFD